MLGQHSGYLEQQIAASLKKKSLYSGRVSSDELGSILIKVLETIIEEQKFAGIDVPIKYQVSEMNVRIDRGKADVHCTMQILAPIKATIKFRYTLENDPLAATKKLRLHNNHVEVHEITSTFDFAAKMALKVMDVKQIVRHHLSDPNGVIHRVLPTHLRQQGFNGKIAAVGLEILHDNSIAIAISSDQQKLH